MSRDVRPYLEDMLEACRRVLEYTTGMDFPAYAADRRTRDAVVRNLETPGRGGEEGPREVAERLPAIDWREVRAFRDVLAHGYFGLDERIVWDVVTWRVPAIAGELERHLQRP